MMKSIPIKLSTFAITVLMITSVSQSVSAHLMEAQHGTVNIVDDGAYVIVSFPVSAFDDVDANRDGKVSMLEFNNKRMLITDSIRKNLRLTEGELDTELKGIMLSPEFAHDSSHDDIAQITLMGKFILVSSNSALSLAIDLYSDTESKQTMKIKATRKADNLEQKIELTPHKPSTELVPELKKN